MVQPPFDELLAKAEAGDRGRLPAFVKDKFGAHFAGRLFARRRLHVRCARCGDDKVVAFI